MTCDGCGSKVSSVLHGWWNKEKETIEYCCDVCSKISHSAEPDVYYGYGGGIQTEENIAYPNGHPLAGQPIPFSSKREKAEAMRIAGVREAGDKIKGYRRDDMTPAKRKTYFI